MSRVPYSSAMGSLMYAMVCSHPNLSYVVNAISRYMANLGKNIEKQLSGFSDICMALLMFFCILGELEMELLGMLILILQVTLIKEDLLQGMFLLLVIVISIGKLLCRL